MAVALSTILTDAVGDEFRPSDDFALQVIIEEPAPGLVVDVEAAVDDEAPFAPIHSWRYSEGAIRRFGWQHRVRVRVRGNDAGNAVTVRHSE